MFMGQEIFGSGTQKNKAVNVKPRVGILSRVTEPSATSVKLDRTAMFYAQ